MRLVSLRVTSDIDNLQASTWLYSRAIGRRASSVLVNKGEIPPPRCLLRGAASFDRPTQGTFFRSRFPFPSYSYTHAAGRARSIFR